MTTSQAPLPPLRVDDIIIGDELVCINNESSPIPMNTLVVVTGPLFSNSFGDTIVPCRIINNPIAEFFNLRLNRFIKAKKAKPIIKLLDF